MLEQLSSVTKEEAQVAEMTKICHRSVKCTCVVLCVCMHTCMCVSVNVKALVTPLAFLCVLAINSVKHSIVFSCSWKSP